MSFGLSDRRRRRGRRWAVIRRTFVLLVVVATLGATFWLGRRDADRDIARGEAVVSGLHDQIGDLDRRNAALAAELAKAQGDLAAMQARYVAEVPSGTLRPLADLMARRLADGVEPGRLANLLTLVANQRECDAPVSRRLVVRTPGSPASPSNSVAVPDNSVVITGEGAAAHDAAGSPEAWFDPALPVTVRFTVIGGQAGEVSGLLPIQHRLLAGASEQRFTLTTGGRGFMVVTSERCSFP